MTIKNRYPGRCGKCRVEVAAEHGFAVKVDGMWEVRCSAHAETVGPVAAPAATTRTLTVERVGRRSYLRGDTLVVRGMLRDAGCHWDADAKAWWIGSHTDAVALAERASSAPAEAAPRKRITHCLYSGCGAALSDYQIRGGFKFCSQDCARDQKTGGQSGYFGGKWHQGDND